MSISALDLQIGQLALARGLIDLSTLLWCVTDATDDARPLEELLVQRELLDEETARELTKSIAEMSPSELESVVDAGETVAMETLVERRRRDCDDAVGELLEPIESADTLDTPPPSPLTDDANSKPSVNTDEGTRAEARYEFLDELGRGGMGQILRAQDQVLERQIALKTILPDTAVEKPRERLLAEARLTGQLEHPSIVPVYELGRLSNGEPYYTMRVVTEQSLETILDQRRDDAPEAPSLLNLVQIIRQVCLAIQYAHERGVIHRDLKPENILVGEYGEVFVIDWGIAKVLSDLSDAAGPTTDIGFQVGALIGTPQYMAPEQAHGENEAVDERTDVYALGALLYEIMTLTPVFSNPTVLGLLMTIVQEEPEPPSKRVPDRSVPGPLEEICMRALSKDPADRYPSAQALADELDLFIEGIKERDRQHAAARELIDQARKARQNYNQVRRELAEAMEERDALRDATPAWAEQDQRLKVWQSEDRVEELEIAVERRFGETVRLLGQSLGHMSLDEAHDALATLYWERFIDAEKRNDRAMATYFENLVRQHDTGAFTERLRGLAELTIRAIPETAELTLRRVTEQHRRLITSETVANTTAELQVQRLPHGRYQLSVHAPDHAPVEMPLRLERQATRDITLSLLPGHQVPDDFAVIPAGPFLTGSPDEKAGARKQVTLPTYGIQKTPVTCGEYVEFLNDLAATNMEEAKEHAPRTQADASSYFPIVDGKFIVPTRDSDGDAWDPDWPVCMINFHSANAYAEWRSDRDGLSYRLPTSMEWEKAARGVDGRLYPWGNHFDPSFCRMKETAPGKPLPAPVGSYSDDVSPYGVYDMAGNVSEWTSTPQQNATDNYLLRGGSFNSFSLVCRLDWHLNSPATYRHTHYGFRMVLALDM